MTKQPNGKLAYIGIGTALVLAAGLVVYGEFKGKTTAHVEAAVRQQQQNDETHTRLWRSLSDLTKETMEKLGELDGKLDTVLDRLPN